MIAVGRGRYDGWLRADKGAHSVDRVAAEIHERAAADGQCVAQFAGTVGDGHVKGGFDAAYDTELSAADNIHHALEGGVEAIVERLNQRTAGAR